MRRNWTIWDEFDRMAEDMDLMFAPFFGHRHGNGPHYKLLSGPDNKNGKYPIRANYRKPLTDIYETESNFVASLEMPGVKKEDIRISATNDGISVKVEKNEEKETKDKEKGFYCCERRHAGFYRQFSLPDGTDLDKIKADLKDGVLKLTIPKTEKAKKKQIDIKVN